MVKKTITYKDYNGTERTEDFYFNLNKTEVMEMELTTDGGLENYIRKIVDAKDQGKIVMLFKDLVLKAYGEKSDDGKYFRKSPERSADFAQTEAYVTLFMELATNADAAAAFVNGIVPQDLVPKE